MLFHLIFSLLTTNFQELFLTVPSSSTCANFAHIEFIISNPIPNRNLSSPSCHLPNLFIQQNKAPSSPALMQSVRCLIISFYYPTTTFWQCYLTKQYLNFYIPYNSSYFPNSAFKSSSGVVIGAMP